MEFSASVICPVISEFPTAFSFTTFAVKGFGAIAYRGKQSSELFRTASTRKEDCKSPLALKAVDGAAGPTKTALCVLAEGVEEVLLFSVFTLSLLAQTRFPHGC